MDKYRACTACREVWRSSKPESEKARLNARIAALEKALAATQPKESEGNDGGPK